MDEQKGIIVQGKDDQQVSRRTPHSAMTQDEDGQRVACGQNKILKIVLTLTTIYTYMFPDKL